jgi:hypothetical protein
MATNTGITSNDIYDGLSGIGHIKAYIGIIIGTIISLILLIIGIIFIYKDDTNNYHYIDGIIKKSDCKNYEINLQNNNKITNYKCNLLVSYTFENKTEEKQIFIESSKLYIDNEPVKLRISKKDTKDVKINDSITMKTTGYILIGSAFFVFGLSLLYYYLTYKFKVFSAFSGLGTGISLLRGF